MSMKFAMCAVAEALAVLALTACGGGDDGEEAQATANEVQVTASEAEAEDDVAMETVAAAAGPNLVVRARASLAANVGALMVLRVNGTVVAHTEVRATAYQGYSFTVAAIPAGAKVDVVFTNDGATSSGEDRNLFVESITVNGTTIAATAAGVTFDRGAGTLAFDGLDVLPGTRSLLWNGALRFTLAGVSTASLSPACANFYAARSTFALNADRTLVTATAKAKPAKGVV